LDFLVRDLYVGAGLGFISLLFSWVIMKIIMLTVPYYNYADSNIFIQQINFLSPIPWGFGWEC